MCLYTRRLQTNDGLYTNMLKYPFKVKGAKNLYNSKTDFSGSCIYIHVYVRTAALQIESKIAVQDLMKKIIMKMARAKKKHDGFNILKNKLQMS